MRAAFLLLLVPFAASAAQERDPSSRYSAMLEQSPFALATVVDTPPEPTESFTANWVLTGLAKLRNEKGEEKDFVTIRSRDLQLSFSLLGDEEVKEGEAKGVSLHSVDRQDPTRKSVVILKRGSETGKVEFSQEATAPPAAAPGVNMGAANANQARVLQMQQMQAQQAQQQRMLQLQTFGANKGPAAVQRPPMNGIIQPNPNVTNNGVNTAVPGNGGIIFPQPNGGAVVNPGIPNGADPRRKIRSINTGR